MHDKKTEASSSLASMQRAEDLLRRMTIEEKAMLNSKKEDPVKAVMELTDKMGADAVIDFVNASKTVETDMQFLKKSEAGTGRTIWRRAKIKFSQYANKSIQIDRVIYWNSK